MVSAKTISPSAAEISLQDRLSIIFSTIYQIIALATFAIVPLLAINWLRTPFIGALIEHTMTANGVRPNVVEMWPAFSQGINEFGIRLLEINGEPVLNAQEMQDELQKYAVGDVIMITVIDLDGKQKEIELTLQKFPIGDQIAFLFVPYFIGLVYLLCSIWVFSLRRNDAAGRAFVTFATSVAITLGTLFDLYTTHRFVYLWTFALALSGGGMYIVALVFPESFDLVRRYPILRWLPAVPAIAIALNALPTLYNLNNPLAYAYTWNIAYGFSGLAVVIFLVLAVVRYRTSNSPITREQSRIILFGSLGFAPVGIYLILSSLFLVRFQAWVLIPMIAFPITTAYAILRYRLLNTDYILSRATLYALLAIISVTMYVLLVWGSSLLLGQMVMANDPVILGAMVFIIALGYNPLRSWLTTRVDTLFFRGRAIYQERLQNFSHDLTRSVELPQIISILREYIEQNLRPSRAHIFLHDPLSDQYIAANGRDNKPTTDVRFSVNGALAQALYEPNPVFLADAERLPSNLLPDRARLALLGAQLFIALPGTRQLTGWLAMGPRQTGEPYSRHDLSFAVSLSEQAALAIQRAQVVFDLQRRVHEMNVLGRVAQGVNVTINFDDILELVYAQTIQVLDAQQVRITLYNDATRTFYHVFYLDNDERLTEHENRPIPDGLGLEQDVVRGQRGIITEDYLRECRHRSYMPSIQGIYAWIGVPLNTGNTSIGAISLGSNDPSVTYTREQQEILQAIADQAAGAIVKTQLLEESQRRAKQLEILNQVGRSLTSTLDLDPLLSQILVSAVEILRSEAGSLLLVDAVTDELVFVVTTGPVADDLTGMRLPPGTGLVGKAVESRQPIIDNNVQQSKEWFEKTDENTGFITRSLMVVPMEVREQVIGVIEIINKTDRSPFSPDDQRLLSAFTAQAAVAIQNARLFTMTDQALAARVEELSVMQRIDRELNASLDLSRAMHITLDWAMRQSKAGAGLVAVLEKEGEEEKEDLAIRVMASQGYTPYDFNSKQDLERVKNISAIQEALQGKMPLQNDGRNGTHYLLMGGQSQMVMPIRREEQTIGLIILESAVTDNFDDEATAFLTRLSDHAAIAISNSQLFAEVETANAAKSDFINFVSHELKTPMTSIQGYTDLLAKGAIGSINEAQAGFLATIRANVKRMDRLVSDLADISRIEAGRLRLDFVAVPMQEVVDEVVRSTKGQIDEKAQTLIVDVPENLPSVWGDRTRIIQVLTNLVSNAHKYTPHQGQILLRAERSKNQWDTHKEAAPEVIHLYVQDSGIGIKPEDQKQIFSKFFRSDDPKARESPGTGLGLNITKNLVELQGGQIWFESEFRIGTTFHFTIPIAEII
ncbi:MAG TPA: GAF domain-containing protein [Anaerolineales bacterium]|nr:GAF domain-containing protein [Anaerolineales bacterium]